MKIHFWIYVLSFLLLTTGCATASEIYEFKSDGCSLFPNGTLKDRTLWCDCCFKHDIAYWRGGSRVERKEADKALHACVLERTKNIILADMMYNGVRFGGSASFPMWYRWGYGWKYGRGYQPLTDEEQKQASDKLEEYMKIHTSGFCDKH